MKNFVKSSYLALVALIATAFSACTNDYEYTAATAPENEVYFSNALVSTIEIDKNAGSFEVALNRVSDKGSITVPLTFEAGEGNVYNVPSSVTFADGQKETKIAVTYNPDDIQYGQYVGGTIKIGGAEFDTTYGISAYTFNAGCTAWVAWGIGSYREDCMTTFFGVENVVYDVMIERNKIEEGMYRMVNPYGKAYPYNEAGDWDDTQDYYITINAKDPNHVYVEKSPTGMDWSHGMVSIWSLASYNIGKGSSVDAVIAEHPEYFGTLENGVITMPAKSLLISMANYNNGGFYPSGVNGQWAVALPGSAIADYSVDFAYTGRYTDKDGNNYCCGNITWGPDVAYAKYALTTADELQNTYEAIMAGAECGVAEQQGEVRMPFETSGNYIVLVVPYDSDGIAQEYATVKVKLDDGKGQASEWQPAYIGNFKYTLFFGSDEEPAVDKDLVLYQSTKDPSRYKIEPWGMERSLTFTMNEDGTLMVDADQETGYTHSSKGMVYVDDTQHYTGSTNYGVSKYENGVFKFALVYYVDAGVLTNGYETFTLTAAAESKGYNKAKAYSFVAQKKVYADKVNPRMMKRVSDLQYFAN